MDGHFFIALNTFKTSGFISTEILPAYVVTFANHHSQVSRIHLLCFSSWGINFFLPLPKIWENEPEWDAASRHVFFHQGLAHSFHSTPGSFFFFFSEFWKNLSAFLSFFVTWFYHFRREEFPQALSPAFLNSQNISFKGLNWKFHHDGEFSKVPQFEIERKVKYNHNHSTCSSSLKY